MSFDVLFNQFMSGIARGSLLFLVASGLSLTFGVLRVPELCPWVPVHVGGIPLLQCMDIPVNADVRVLYCGSSRCRYHGGS